MDHKKIFEYFELVGKLKDLKRTGWARLDVGDPETVACHMYRMAMIAMTLPSEEYDLYKLLRMCLVHDLAEAIVGDITPYCGVSDDEKHSRERAAMQHISSLAGEEHAQEFLDLWFEFEENKTKESIMAHDLDKFDMIHQAFEYEQNKVQPGHLQSFFDNTASYFKTGIVKDWVTELIKRRETLLKSKK